jgi:hypothetical protein
MYSWILVVDVVQLHIFMFLVVCCDVRCVFILVTYMYSWILVVDVVQLHIFMF